MTTINSCATSRFSPAPVAPSPSDAVPSTISRLNLLKKVEIANAARPEIVATENRVFVVYLEPLRENRSFKVKIYDRDLLKEITSKTLVSTSSQYGGPTDIRVISDREYLYAFYETANERQGKTYLWGAKYTLDDRFEATASSGLIATSTIFTVAKPADEKLDDPAPMLDGNNVYVMTRYKSSVAMTGETRYKLYRFDKNLKQQSAFDLDLSAYADGEARQSSILYANGYYYLAMQTTVDDSRKIDEVQWTVTSRIMVVRLNRNWNVVDSKIISADQGYTEGYVVGLKSDDNYFYETHSQVILGKEFSSVIKIYDREWNPVLSQKYVSLTNVKPGGVEPTRPSIDVTPDRVYAGNSSGEGFKAEVYVFNKGK